MRLVWRAFYTKPRHEKKAKERLEGRGYDVFCPLLKTKVRWSDRWKHVYKPVMPGYLFARVNDAERLDVVQDPSILNTVFWNRKPALIRDEEIRAMRFLLEEADAAATAAFRSGDLVHVETGNLAGFDGVVVQVSKNVVCLRLEGLQCDFVVSVPKRHLKQGIQPVAAPA